MSGGFVFQKNQHLIVDGTEYYVTGGMEFHNRSDGSRWTEYCIRTVKGNQEKWLSIDNIYQEYAIYTTCGYSDKFSPEGMSRNGYYQADSGDAVVTSNYFGNVDVENGDRVHYIEYEDRTEEQILAVEQWEDETEYATGYYLDRDEIVPIGESVSADSGNYDDKPKRKGIGWLIWVIAILAVAIGVIFPQIQGNKIAKYLKSSADFTYETSITSDINSKEKADVYRTDLTIEEAAKRIIQAIEGDTEEVQESDEDDSVAILTKKEYCLVYADEDGDTLVQISDRAYVYQSTNSPYRSSHHTRSYYRRFYYSRGYDSDRDKYGNRTSGYEDYDGAYVSTDYTDTYRSYSSSVRQSSINSRSSSSGGIGFGK